MKLRARRGLVLVSLMGALAGACGAGSEGGTTTVSEPLASSDGAVSATISFNDWGSAYNGTVTVTNNGNTPTSTWSVVVNSRGSAITQVWSANSQISGSTATFTPLAWNAAIPAHGSISFGFSASPGGAANEAQLVTVTQSGSTGGGATGTAGAGGSGGSAGAVNHAGTGGGGATGTGATGSGATAGVGGTAGATSGGSCTPQTFEAESMTHSTGGAQDSGWDIWSNGNISTNVSFSGGSTTITVVAKGTSAGGVWPNMVVRVNGVQIGSATVNSATYANYPFTFSATAGSQSVSVEFTNDALIGTEDRNLIVDKFAVSCTGGSTGAGGATGGGGSTGTAGASGSGGSSGGGATSCSVPPALGSGSQSLTWYYFGQGTAKNGSQYQTACGYLGSESGTDDTVTNIATPSDYFVAIPGATSSNFTNSNYCGACVQITNANNGRSVTATVIDECPVDSNPACAAAGHLDVSKTAFDALGFSVGNPSSGVSWKVVPCNVAGNVKVRVKSGNANQVYIENERLPIQSVTQNGGQATRLSYGAWQLPSNAAGTTLVLTDSSGRQVSVAVSGSTSDQDTGKQFPACQ